jgi:hypothetical protein
MATPVAVLRICALSLGGCEIYTGLLNGTEVAYVICAMPAVI